MTDRQKHARLAVPAICFTFQVVIEETFLKRAAIVGIKMSPVLDPMHFEPLLRGCRSHEALEIATGMQSLAAPIRRGKQRHGHLGPIGRAALAVVVVERVREEIGAEIAPVGGQLYLRERLRPTHEITGSAAAGPALSKPVLHRLDLHVVPVCPERTINAAVMRSIAVP